MSKIVRSLVLRSLSARSFHRTAPVFSKVAVRDITKLKQMQKKFQVDDGLPIWLKGGAKDKILYQISLIGIFVNFVLGLEAVWHLIAPH